MLFDSYFTFESKLGWHRLFLTVESTRGIRTLVVVFELLEELVAWGCRNGKFNEKFKKKGTSWNHQMQGKMNKGGKFLKKLWCCVGGRV